MAFTAGFGFSFGVASSLRLGLLVAELTTVALLARGEWHVVVVDHVADLFPHGDGEEGDEIDQENRPEDRDVEEGHEGAKDGDKYSPRGGIPARRCALGDSNQKWRGRRTKT